MGFICDTDTPINDVPLNDDCREALAQVQKVLLQKVFSAGVTKNTIADPTLLASFTPLLAAADNTKVVQTPYLNAPASEAGEPVFFGEGAETRDRTGIFLRNDPSTFEAMIYDSKQDTIEALKSYRQKGEIGVYLIDENGDIGCLADDVETPTTYFPIPVRAFYVGDKQLGQGEAPDMNKIGWKLKADWSDKFTVVRPTDFNALTDLVTP